MWLPVIRRTARPISSGFTTMSAPSARGQCLLMRVAGAHDDLHAGHVPAQPGDRAQTHRAGAQHGDDRTVDVTEHGPA